MSDQKITIKHDPVFHVIIDNLFGLKSREIFSHIVSLKKYYTESMIGSRILDKNYRSNLTCYIDVLYYKDFRLANGSVDLFSQRIFRSYSPLLREVDNLFMNGKIRDMMISAPYPLCKFDSLNTWETQISRYGNKQFYKWHYDRIRDERIISLVYYVSILPRKFEGGELCITNGLQYDDKLLDESDIVEISPEKDRLIIFNSRTLHCVKPTKSPDRFEDGRFSVNIWAGKRGSFDINSQL